MRHNFHPFDNHIEANGMQKGPPPFNVTVMKGSRYVILKRGFAEFVVSVIFLSVIFC